MPRIRKQTRVWVTSNGRQVRICDMPDKMLVGTLKMLKRAGKIWQALRVVELTDGKGAEKNAFTPVDVGVAQEHQCQVALNFALCSCTPPACMLRPPAERVMHVLSDSWRDHVPERAFFDSMELDAERRGINWDDGARATLDDLMERAKAVRENLAKAAQYEAGSSRGSRKADI